MSEEKKNEVTEEVKETRELTEKELAQVSGGVEPMPTAVWMGIPRSEG